MPKGLIGSSSIETIWPSKSRSALLKGLTGAAIASSLLEAKRENGSRLTIPSTSLTQKSQHNRFSEAVENRRPNHYGIGVRIPFCTGRNYYEFGRPHTR